jgi:hypothetical protein
MNEFTDLSYIKKFLKILPTLSKKIIYASFIKLLHLELNKYFFIKNFKVLEARAGIKILQKIK